jgi:hypothetical protein
MIMSLTSFVKAISMLGIEEYESSMNISCKSCHYLVQRYVDKKNKKIKAKSTCPTYNIYYKHVVSLFSSPE